MFGSAPLHGSASAGRAPLAVAGCCHPSQLGRVRWRMPPPCPPLLPAGMEQPANTEVALLRRRLARRLGVHPAWLHLACLIPRRTWLRLDDTEAAPHNPLLRVRQTLATYGLGARGSQEVYLALLKVRQGMYVHRASRRASCHAEGM